MILQILETNGSCRILLHLLEHPKGMNKSYPRNFVSAYRTAEKVLSQLLENQLIRTKNSTKLLYILTNKGRLVAEKLRDIQQIMNTGVETINPEIKDIIEVDYILSEEAFKLHLPPVLLATWESDWDGRNGTNLQVQHKTRIKKIAMKYKDTRPEYYDVFQKRFYPN